MKTDGVFDIFQNIFISMALGITALKLGTKSEKAVFILLNHYGEVIRFHNISIIADKNHKIKQGVDRHWAENIPEKARAENLTLENWKKLSSKILWLS